MKTIDTIELGATLFVPANHKSLKNIVSGEKYPHLKSVVIDTEDALEADELEFALLNFQELLHLDVDFKPYVFVRPRDTQILDEVLGYDNISKIDGFILPKFSLQNAKSYLQTLEEKDFCIMPSIEGEELFHPQKLEQLLEILLGYKEKIILIRFGLEDMLKALRMRRRCGENVFDIAASGSVLGSFIALFKSAGFSVSGGVYPCYHDSEGFIADVKRDLQEGLFSKTIIHPNQIELTNEVYRVTQEEFEEALEILKSEKNIFAQNAKMAEKTTMTPWAQEIVKRAEVYGVY